MTALGEKQRVSTVQGAPSSHTRSLPPSRSSIDRTNLTPSSVSQRLPTCLLAPHLLATQLTNLQPQTTFFCYIELFSTYDTPGFSANFWLSTFNDHRTAMHRQQNPPNVPIIELGAFVGLGSDVSWGRNDHRNTALFCLYWVSMAHRRERKTRWLDGRTGS